MRNDKMNIKIFMPYILIIGMIFTFVFNLFWQDIIVSLFIGIVFSLLLWTFIIAIDSVQSNK